MNGRENTPNDVLYDLDQFRSAARAGAFRKVRLRGAGVQFVVEGVGREEEERITLVTTRERRFRYFRNAEGALQLLQEIGVRVVEVEMAGWRPMREKEWRPKRPDMAERLKLAHATAKADRMRELSGDLGLPGE